MPRFTLQGSFLMLIVLSNLSTFFLLLWVTLRSDLRSGLSSKVKQTANSSTVAPLEGHSQRMNLSTEDVAFLDAQQFRDVAIIVPYRYREFHLRVFAPYMTHFLSLQNISYAIYVIEQSPKGLFNRAKLMNIGFQEAMAEHNFSCVIFHDVDLLPEEPEMTYACQNDPVHLSVAVDTLNRSLPYEEIFGGVTALTPAMMSLLNGFSNDYWGWGGEDDDMSTRLSAVHAKIQRPSSKLGRYTMLTGEKHVRAKMNLSRFHRLRLTRNRMEYDGLNSLKYSVLWRAKTPLYTRITAETYPPWAAIKQERQTSGY